MNGIERVLQAVAAVGFVVLLIVIVNAIAGCGSNIPIGEAPTCTDLVTDECVPEVVEEFCSTPSTPEELLTLHVEQYERGFLDGITVGADACEETRVTDKTAEELLTLHVEQYDRGFLDGVDSVECDTFEAICKRLPYGIRKEQPECSAYCND